MERRKAKGGLANELEILYEVIDLFSGHFTQDEELGIIIDSIFKQPYAQACGVLVKDPKKKQFVIQASQGLSQKFLKEFSKKQKTAALDKLNQAKQLTIIKPGQKVAGAAVKFEKAFGSLVVLPLKIEGKDAGLLFLESVARHAYSPTEADILKAFAVMVVISLTREGLIRKSHELDIIDDLTSLYNIQYFRKRLAIEFRRAQQHSEPLSAIVINIDNFEEYCRKNGQDRGEQALIEVATIIRNQVRTMDIIARYSLNQIVTSLYNCNAKNAAKVAERIIQKIKGTRFKPAKPALGASIGIASFPSTYAENENDLLDCAEEAVYQAYRAGGFKTNVYK